MNSRAQRIPVLVALATGVQLLLSAACATAPVAKEEDPAPPPSPAPRRSFNPVAFAAQFARPADCELGARELQASSRDAAWAALKACIDKGNFPLLQPLMSSAWLRDLQTRPEAPALLAKVIAMRGGAISVDLQMLHERQIPLFSLDDGISQPDLYRGRYVVFRAKVSEMRADGGAFTAKLEEMALRSEEWDGQVGLAHRRVVRNRASASAQGRIIPLGSGAVSGGYDTSSDEVNSHTRKRYDNISVETGHEALARLPQPDPFLEPGKEFIVLARFDDVRTTSSSSAEEEPDVVPVLTLVSFNAPNPLVVY